MHQFMNYLDESDLNEATFNAKRLDKVCKLLSKLTEKRFGKLGRLGTVERFDNNILGYGRGYRYISNTSGAMFRFNWLQESDRDKNKDLKDLKFSISGVDYWKPGTNFNTPSVSIKFGSHLNIVQVWESILNTLESGKISESDENLMTTSLNATLNERRTKKEKEDWMKSKGLPKSYGKNGDDVLLKYVNKKGGAELAEELEVFLNSTETNTIEDAIVKSEKKFADSKVYSDPDYVFDDIEALTGMVGRGDWRSLVVCGMGGVGKTFHINKKLKELLGSDYIYHSGVNASAASFYTTLFQERKEVIVFDEADDLLLDKEIVMMLKPLLDTYGDNTAEYFKNTQSMVGRDENEIKAFSDEVDIDILAGQIPNQRGNAGVLLPSKYYFEGSMIFISNLPASKIDQAIMSRSMFIDVHLAAHDVQKRIRTILDLGITEDVDEGLLTYRKNDVDEVLEALGQDPNFEDAPTVQYMTPELSRKGKQLTVRSGKIGLLMKLTNLPDWKRLCGMYA
jgi:hypothetical protein